MTVSKKLDHFRKALEHRLTFPMFVEGDDNLFNFIRAKNRVELARQELATACFLVGTGHTMKDVEFRIVKLGGSIIRRHQGSITEDQLRAHIARLIGFYK